MLPYPPYGTNLIIFLLNRPNSIPGVTFNVDPLLLINSEIPISVVEYIIPKWVEPYASNFPRNFFSAGVYGISPLSDFALLILFIILKCDLGYKRINLWSICSSVDFKQKLRISAALNSPFSGLLFSLYILYVS